MSSMYGMPRRRFVKRLLFGSVLSISARKSWIQSVTYAATPAAVGEAGQLRVSFDEFPALQSEFGSIRLSVNPIGEDEFPDGNFYPILINHAPGGGFFAMSSKCSHAQCVVAAYDDLEQGLRCPCHNSLYGFDGQVLQGPARRPLEALPFSFESPGLMIVQVPGLGYRVSVSAVVSQKARLQLTFPTSLNVSYEVGYRSHIDAARQPVQFSLSPDGPMDQSAWIGDDTPATVYVENPGVTGFYDVSMVVLDVT